MQTGYGIQQAINADTVANMQNTNALQAQLANCCCETREAIQGVNYNMATNTCALQNTMCNNTRDIIDSQQAGTRAILDFLTNDKIATLQAENNDLRRAASQDRQNALLTSAMSAQTNQIIDAVRPTPVAGDISSLFNVDYSTVAQNLQSGLIGQSRALYKYGIDITNATLATYAYNLGISKSVSEMTQMEKQQLRVLAILDQSKVSWGDLANRRKKVNDIAYLPSVA